MFFVDSFEKEYNFVEIYAYVHNMRCNNKTFMILKWKAKIIAPLVFDPADLHTFTYRTFHKTLPRSSATEEL